ncbi:MAG: amino acid adenylation domain-containing protein, partial [Candidatus Aminicenantes bacterium]
LNRYANRVARVVMEKYDDRYRLNENEKIRYNRQLMLHKWGIEEQEKLKSTTVFAAGAGGSGSPLIMQLALMGIGTIIVCDFDEVELSNLNRQLLHDESRIGINKALSAQMTVKRINPNVKVIPISQKLTRENVHELVGEAEIIFDNLDDLEAKFILSEYAVAHQVPHVISSMIDLNAYAAVFHSPPTPCFHCIHDRNLLEEIREIKARVKNYQETPNPVAPPPLFMSTGFAANEAVKILLGFENPAYNKYFFMNQRGTPDIVNSQGYRLITYTFTDHFKKISKRQGFDWDVGWGGKFFEELEIEPDPSCPVCGDAAKKRNHRTEIAAIKEKEPVKPVEKAIIDNEPGEPGDKTAAAALLFGHDTHMIAGIMGTLKANKAYVPLDPSYPLQRLQFMLEDSGARVILTDNRNFNLAVKVRDNVNKRIPIINVNKIYHDERIPGENLGLPIKPGNFAYILYTSGSTGAPKGVIQNHRNVLHFARVYTNALHIHPGDRLTLFSSYGFDAAKMDIFGALLNGAALYPYDIKQEESLDRLPDWLRNEGLTIFHSIPTVYRYFTDMLTQDESFPDIRFVVMGGEAVHKKDVDKYKHYFPDTCIFINGLGPTESTVTLQYFINKESEILKDSVPVGYPVDETGVFLINKAGEETRVYEVGEIVFKSDYLALGYLNHREKTDAVFVTDPLTGSGRVYRTGDLGRRLPDGTIEYVGRKDFQVKVRGYRIELAEIENKLDTIAGIKKSVVVCQQEPNGESYLAAFYIKNQGQTVDELYVIRELKASLPDYMIPNVFWRVEDFPLTATGKIDRKALAKWKKGFQEPEVPYAP